MATYRPTLDLDKTGILPENKVSNELHQIGTGPDRLVLLKYGSFYKEGLEIVDTATGELLKEEQYHLVELYQELSLKTAKDIYNCILIADRAVSDSISVSYHAVGGPLNYHKSELLSWYNERIQQASIQTDYKDIGGKPVRYMPQRHVQHTQDLFGAEYLVDQIKRLEESIQMDTSQSNDDFLALLANKLDLLQEDTHIAVGDTIQRLGSELSQWINKNTAGLGALQNYPVMDEKTAQAIALPGYAPTSQAQMYLTLNGLHAFAQVLKEKIVKYESTHIDQKTPTYKEPNKASILSSVSGEIFLFRSKQYAADNGLDYDIDMYPLDIGQKEELAIVKVSSTDINHGGIWMAYGLESQNVYVAHLPNDVCSTSFRYNRILVEGELKELSELITAHLKDTKNPHELTKAQVKLGKVENLPVVATEDIMSEKGAYKYVTMDTLMYYTKKYLTNAKPPLGPDDPPDPNRRTMEEDMIIFSQCRTCVPDPPAPSKGQLIRTWCEGSDRFARYTNGTGGFEDKVLELDSDDCKFYAVPNAGTVLAVFCDATTKKSTIADGKGGQYDVVTQIRSEDCGYRAPLAEGTKIAEYCQGMNFMTRYADGEGNSFDMISVLNSEDCGYKPHADAGTVLSEFCQGFDKIVRYADGKGSYYDGIDAINSEECGYEPPNKPPQKGTIISVKCLGSDEMTTYADGKGGEFVEITAQKSRRCGYLGVPAKGTIVSFRCDGTTGYTRFADGEGGETDEITSINSKRCGGTGGDPEPPAPAPTPGEGGGGGGGGGGTTPDLPVDIPVTEPLAYAIESPGMGTTSKAIPGTGRNVYGFTMSGIQFRITNGEVISDTEAILSFEGKIPVSRADVSNYLNGGAYLIALAAWVTSGSSSSTPVVVESVWANHPNNPDFPPIETGQNGGFQPYINLHKYQHYPLYGDQLDPSQAVQSTIWHWYDTRTKQTFSTTGWQSYSPALKYLIAMAIDKLDYELFRNPDFINNYDMSEFENDFSLDANGNITGRIRRSNVAYDATTWKAVTYDPLATTSPPPPAPAPSGDPSLPGVLLYSTCRGVELTKTYRNAQGEHIEVVEKYSDYCYDHYKFFQPFKQPSQRPNIPQTVYFGSSCQGNPEGTAQLAFYRDVIDGSNTGRAIVDNDSVICKDRSGYLGELVGEFCENGNRIYIYALTGIFLGDGAGYPKTNYYFKDIGPDSRCTLPNDPPREVEYGQFIGQVYEHGNPSDWPVEIKKATVQTFTHSSFIHEQSNHSVPVYDYKMTFRVAHTRPPEERKWTMAVNTNTVEGLGDIRFNEAGRLRMIYGSIYPDMAGQSAAQDGFTYSHFEYIKPEYGAYKTKTFPVNKEKMKYALLVYRFLMAIIRKGLMEGYKPPSSTFNFQNFTQVVGPRTYEYKLRISLTESYDENTSAYKSIYSINNEPAQYEVFFSFVPYKEGNNYLANMELSGRP